MSCPECKAEIEWEDGASLRYDAAWVEGRCACDDGCWLIRDWDADEIDDDDIPSGAQEWMRDYDGAGRVIEIVLWVPT